MPRLLAVGHVTWDRTRDGGEVAGGSVTYASLAGRRLGWDAAVLSAAGADFDPARELPGVEAFLARGPATTRFVNTYDDDGTRHQVLAARAEPIVLDPLPDTWRDPDVLLLGPVAGEIGSGLAAGFDAAVVGAIAQGWLREADAGGRIGPRAWADPARALAGVHVLFLSEHDLPEADAFAREALAWVPIVVVTRGWRGATVLTRDAVTPVPTLPRPEVDPTGAGDVFATAFLLEYQASGDSASAAAFAGCAASCVVEGIGTATLGDRAEVARRVAQLEKMVEDGEWEAD